MLLSHRTNGLTSLFREVRVFKARGFLKMVSLPSEAAKEASFEADMLIGEKVTLLTQDHKGKQKDKFKEEDGNTGCIARLQGR